MKLTVNSATIQFGEGQTTGILVGFNYYDGTESLSGVISVPIENISDMRYDTLAVITKNELIKRLTTEVPED